MSRHLIRTTSSTGDRRAHTISFWIKRNKTLWSTIQGIFNASGSNFLRFNDDYQGATIRMRFQNGTSNFYRPKYRDSGSWVHILLNVDTTLERIEDRINLYINGILINDVDGSAGGPGQNLLELFSEKTQTLTIGSTGSSQWLLAGMCDFFFVDGRALTPDMFGYVQDDTGTSALGISKKTNGQWRPKKPSLIKESIINSGGFGSNGVYLPMNDGSNAGADFHCDPNTIIKLKGENDPQPKNGAPETSNSYVDQLREDAFKDYLVLAIPGISTGTSNLLTNGHFDDGVDGWYAQTSQITVDDGRLQVTRTGGLGPTCYQPVTTVIGRRYSLSGISWSSDGGGRGDIRAYSDQGTTMLANASGQTNIRLRTSVSFTATSTTTYIYLTNDNTGLCQFDDIVLKEEPVLDYSADIKGSGTNKTFTYHNNAGIATSTTSFYGSALYFPGGSGLEIDGSSDFNFGTGDFTVEFWLYDIDTLATYRRWISSTNGAFTGNTYIFRESPSNSVQIAAGTGTSGYVLNKDTWNHWAHVRKDGVEYVYLNGSCVYIYKTDIKNYTEGESNKLYIGGWYDANGSEYTRGYMQDIRIYKGVAKYTSGFDVARPFNPVSSDGFHSYYTTIDNPVNNYCTMNSLVPINNPNYANDNTTDFQNGGIRLVKSAASSNEPVFGNFGVSSGKWYYEVTVSKAISGGPKIGWAYSAEPSTFGHSVGGASRPTHVGISFYDQNLNRDSYATYELYNNRSGVNDIGSLLNQGDIIGVALDMSGNGDCKFYVNGELALRAYNFLNNSNIPLVRTGITLRPYLQPEGGNNSYTINFNFGQDPSFSGSKSVGTVYSDSNGRGKFKYQPPSDYLSLCTKNLPEPVIKDPGDYFKTVLYIGDDDDSHYIKSVGFKPDLVVLKGLTQSDWAWYDSYRGPGNRLRSNSTAGQSTTYGLKSFEEKGFTLSNAGYNYGGGGTKTSASEYIAYCWKAGGEFKPNHLGTLTSSVNVSTDAGFSIVRYNGAENGSVIGHGLSQKPEFIIMKEYLATGDWMVWCEELEMLETQGINLNNTGPLFTSGSNTFIKNVTDTTITVGTSNMVGGTGNDIIAYCWHNVDGFSKFGIYKGLGGTDLDGPFVHCGFKPAFLMLRNAEATAEDWVILDSTRNPYNPIIRRLDPHLDIAETALGNAQDGTTINYPNVDFVSNGFKVRSGGPMISQYNTKIIYMAFAECPFKYSNAK